ncbi:MAG: hypothetical protein EB060_07535 [Proteobacteria bacterium]|nr:hypothetical protein [Pseudomonadota bacterium]
MAKRKAAARQDFDIPLTTNGTYWSMILMIDGMGFSGQHAYETNRLPVPSFRDFLDASGLNRETLRTAMAERGHTVDPEYWNAVVFPFLHDGLSTVSFQRPAGATRMREMDALFDRSEGELFERMRSSFFEALGGLLAERAVANERPIVLATETAKAMTAKEAYFTGRGLRDTARRFGSVLQEDLGVLDRKYQTLGESGLEHVYNRLVADQADLGWPDTFAKFSKKIDKLSDHASGLEKSSPLTPQQLVAFGEAITLQLALASEIEDPRDRAREVVKPAPAPSPGYQESVVPRDASAVLEQRQDAEPPASVLVRTTMGGTELFRGTATLQLTNASKNEAFYVFEAAELMTDVVVPATHANQFWRRMQDLMQQQSNYLAEVLMPERQSIALSTLGRVRKEMDAEIARGANRGGG